MTNANGERWSAEATYAACAVGSWTPDDERAHRELLRTAPEYGMFRDHRKAK